MLAVDLKGQTLVEVHLTPDVEKRLEDLSNRSKASPQFVLSTLLERFRTNNGTPECPQELAAAYRLLPVKNELIEYAKSVAAQSGVDHKQVIQGIVEHELDEIGEATLG